MSTAAPLTPRAVPRRGRLARVARALGVAALVLVLGAVGVFAAFGRDWIARGVVRAPNAGVTVRPEEDPGAAELTKNGVDRQLRIEVGPPTASLSVWLIEPTSAPRATVLVLHGIRSDRFWQLGLARKIAALGYRVVLPDLRGHGRSSGDWLTYGVVEARDLSQVLDALDREGLLVGRVGAVGTSYGAATSIELAGIDSRVAAVVAIAPFSSLRDVVPAYVRHYAPVVSLLVPDWFVAEGIDRAGRLGSFDPGAASPLDAIAKTGAHVLLIHGTSDTNIPPAQSEALQRVAPERTRLILVSGADHFSITGDPSGEIERDGMAWLGDWL